MTSLTPLDIIRQIGIANLLGDGGSCSCGGFKVGGVTVEFSCWRVARIEDKVGSLITISGNGNASRDDLSAIGEECLSRVGAISGDTEWHVEIL